MIPEALDLSLALRDVSSTELMAVVAVILLLSL